MKKVVIVGQGYVGLPLAMRAVEVGYRVVGFDTDPARIARLASGQSYIEDVSSARVVAVITVPTPLRDGTPDLSYIEQAARTIGPFITSGACVVLESTTYPGTTEDLLVPILEDGSKLAAGRDFLVGYSPERLDAGNPQWSLANTPKVVSGIDQASLSAVKDFYGSLVERTVPVETTREAELVKLIENTFRHVNIALVNEIAMFANDLGIDVWRALDAAATKPFGFMRFDPGPGVGGHCLPVDPSYLAWQVKRSVGDTFRFVELANDVNDHMPAYVVRRLIQALNDREQPVRGRRVLLLGLAYKPNTGDARESPAVAVAERLAGLGAEVRAVDPHVDDDCIAPVIARAALTADEVAAADAVVLLTHHDDFDLDLVVRHARYVLDTRHCMAGAQVEHL